MRTRATNVNLRRRVVRIVAVRLEKRMLRLEAQLHGPDFSIAMFGKDEFGEIRLGRRLFIVIRIAIQKRNDIRFLLDSSGIVRSADRPPRNYAAHRQ